MIVNRVLDELFSRWSNIAVLRALNKHVLGMSGREVARVAGIANKNCITALVDLENMGIVDCERGGRQHSYKLNRSNSIVVEALIPLLQYEEEFIGKIASFIKTKLKNKTVSLIVFGSVARKEDTMKSDFDLCLVAADAKEKSKAEDALFDITFDIRKKYGVFVSPIFYTKREFALRARKNKAPVNNIVKEGKVISGLSIKELLK